VGRLSSAIKYFDEKSVDVILTDLNLPDSHGLDTLAELIEKNPEVPIIVLSGIEDEKLALSAVKSGAQDYLIKGQIDYERLIRSIRYSIERHHLLQAIKSISITDELTGLYNRRGFLLLAKKQLEMASRFKKLLWLIYLDIDNMKAINDNLGHKEGDKALIDVSDILKRTFRESDIVARIGGDEFAIIAVNEVGLDSEQMVARIHENTKAFTGGTWRPYKLSVSIGAVASDCIPDCDIDEMLSMADKVMYKEKISKKTQSDAD
jgi:diguanylate cyclase (GGDEF)-like protein